MIENVSKTEKINQRLKSENKVRTLNSPDDLNVIIEMNDEMEKSIIEYQEKDRNTQLAAFSVILKR